MKRLFFISIIAFTGITGLFAQTVFDAFKAADSDFNGSARYSGMAGAFGALGGDASAIKDNPAGLGVFRKSEISLSVNSLWQSSKATWNDAVSKDSKMHFGMNNFALVFAVPFRKTSGLVSSNFSFTYNKLKNFNRNISIKSANLVPASITDYYAKNTPVDADNNFDFDDYSDSWMSVLAWEGYLINWSNVDGKWTSFLKSDEHVLPDYQLHESGGISEYAFSWAGNINNRLFIGASLNFRSLNYSLYSIYNEDFESGGGMTMHSWVDMKGTGVNANVGLIYTPVDFLRIGAAIHTPAVYSELSVANRSELDSYAYDYENDEPTNIEGIATPENEHTSSLHTPFQAHGSIAVLFGKRGLLSAEYIYKNYKGMYFTDYTTGSPAEYSYDNDDIKTMLNSTSSFKIGGEYKVTDNWAVRAGYAYMPAINNKNTEKIPLINTVRTDMEYFINNGSRYITAGFGYREAFWYIDFAFTNQKLKETFYAFNPNFNTDVYKPGTIKPANINNYLNNLTVSLGLRF